MFWISLVPVTITEALGQTRTDHSFSPCADERYAYREQFSEYAGVWQKWVLYRLTPMYKREEKTFEKNQGSSWSRQRHLFENSVHRSLPVRWMRGAQQRHDSKSTRGTSSANLRSSQFPEKPRRNSVGRRPENRSFCRIRSLRRSSTIPR